MCNEKKDFSLLRPFDLEAAKAGAEICFYADGHHAKYFGESDQVKRDICVQWLETKYSVIEGKFAILERDSFRMAPLCWLEGSPVYKGDVLYDKKYGTRQAVRRLGAHDTLEAYQPRKDGAYVICLEDATWTPPKVKRKASLLGFIHCSTKEVLLREEPIYCNKVFWERFPQLDTTIEIEE